MPARPYEVLGSEVILENPFLRVRADRIRGRSTEGVHYVVELPRAATIVPVLDDGRILMIRQYRHSVRDVILELPGGRIDASETPEDAARRELLEETGYAAKSFHLLGSFIPAAGLLDHVGFLFAARGLEPGRSRPEALEEIEVVPMTMDEVASGLLSGQIVDGFCLAGLFRFFLHEGWVFPGGRAPDPSR